MNVPVEYLAGQVSDTWGLLTHESDFAWLIWPAVIVGFLYSLWWMVVRAFSAGRSMQAESQTSSALVSVTGAQVSVFSRESANLRIGLGSRQRLRTRRSRGTALPSGSETSELSSYTSSVQRDAQGYPVATRGDMAAYDASRGGA